jgi:hypothetical protein
MWSRGATTYCAALWQKKVLAQIGEKDFKHTVTAAKGCLAHSKYTRTVDVVTSTTTEKMGLWQKLYN